MTGSRVTVMGLGHFGGGAGVTRWLVETRGCDVLLTDLAPPHELAESLESIRDLIEAGRVELRLGGHDERDFTEADLIVANPAVPRPWENRFLQAARRAGVPITTEIELLLGTLPSRERIIAVTGTAGKSTTTAMIHHALAARSSRSSAQVATSKAHLGGNIGGSLLGADVGPEDWVVLELSSAMLHWLGESASCSFAPRIAVVTNLSDNHIDWHGSLEHYRQSKQRLLAAQQPGDTAILGPGLKDWPTRPGVRRIDVDGEDQRLAPINLLVPGRHNRLNALVAAEACAAVGIALPDALRAIESFPGLPHRLQLVAATPDGRRFYNDSKCTTPAAAVLAVESFDDPSRIHLIVGGYDKKADLAPLAALGERVARLYAIGAVGQVLHDLAPPGSCLHCRTLEVAVSNAAMRLVAGDVLLLSPGCASWDQFTNFEQRGDLFTRLVRQRLET
ncbi:MAG: UDP-N-acetylmuramoyl-L-alanine--D-glutamate ligase [Phycisphaerales bacterium]|nr:UDP-N-acetylmuramoyl-L-alanine--D-glutamate ligase [Phycisphaerales bacterium]